MATNTQNEDRRSDAVGQSKRDFRKEVTEQIVAMLEKGTAPWQKPWEPGAIQLPFNPTTEHSYRGGNAITLMASSVRKGFDDPRWLTYRQAQEQGWQVKQGEKGTQIEFWQFDKSSEVRRSPGNQDEREDEPSQADSQSRGLLRRVYTVFNAKQIEGMPAYERRMPKEWEVVQTGEQILHNSGARIVHDQKDRAFYNRAADDIHLPKRESFRSAADYYGTALHELGHWSGHPTRLNRQTLNESYRFGDTNYAKEELRAELTSVFLAAERGIPHNPEQHAAYVGSWIKALLDDKNEIFRAARDAHKAADFLLDLEKSKERPKETVAQFHQETSAHVADYEKGSGTVNLLEKQTATENRNQVPGEPSKSQDRLAPVKLEAERILDGEVEGRRPPTNDDLAKSLASITERAQQILGSSARIYPADTESGKYRGPFIAESEHHLVQRISPKSAAAHLKHSLPAGVAPGQSAVVSYAHGLADLKPYRAKEKAHSLGR